PFLGSTCGASGGGAVSSPRRVFVAVSFVSLPHSGQWKRSPMCDAATGEIAPHQGQSNVRSPDRCGASGGAAVRGRSLVLCAVSFVAFLHSGQGKCSPRWSAGTGLIAPHHGQSNVFVTMARLRGRERASILRTARARTGGTAPRREVARRAILFDVA